MTFMGTTSASWFRVVFLTGLLTAFASGAVAQLGEDWREAWDYPARQFSKAVEHDGRLWISGGFFGTGPGAGGGGGDGGIIELIQSSGHRGLSLPIPPVYLARNDVWVSDNGSHWEPVTLDAQFPRRFMHEMVSFQGMLWIFGGFSESGEPLNDVWFSTEGEYWFEAGDGGWSPRGGHSVTEFNGGLWLIGGSGGFLGLSAPELSDEVWFSASGFDWTNLTLSPHFPPQYGHGVAEYNGALWMATGVTEAGFLETEIWLSLDGASWSPVLQGPSPVPMTIFPKLAAFQNKLWVLGGSPDGYPIWGSTTDGANWVHGPPIDSGFAGHSLLTFGDRLHGINLGLLFGDDRRESFGVSTGDGNLWSASLPSRAFSSRFGTSLLKVGSVLLLIGGNDGQHRSDVWGTADGIHWSLVASNPGLTSRTAHRAFWAPNASGTHQVNVLSGVGPDGYRRDRWTTTDLTNWSLAESGSAASFVFNNGRFGLIVDDRNPAAVQVHVIGGLSPGNVPTREVHRRTFSSTPTGWVPLNTTPPFPPRHGHGAVLFNNRYWVVGGVNTSSFLNDVWSSANGVDWIPHTPVGAHFTPRSDHVTLVHDGALWVIGGIGPGGAVKDVWFTLDGEVWTQVTDSLPFPNGLYLEGVSWLNSMWVVVGAGATSAHSSVWRSSDGITWQRANPGGSYGARRGHAMASFDGGMAITGGFDGENTRSDSWWSEDGRMWVPMTGSFSARRYHSAAVMNDRLYVMAGEANDGGLLRDVWSTPSRTTAWTQETGSAAFTARRFTGAEFFNGQIRLMGGQDPAMRNDIWRSTNGSSWLGGNIAGVAGRMGHRVMALDDQLFIVGGFGTGYLRDMWESSNGTSWSEVAFASSDHQPPPRLHHRGASLGGRMWLIGGYDGDLTAAQSDVWSSNGSFWQRVRQSSETPFANRQFHDVAVHDHRLWVTGGTLSADPHYGDVWFSNDPPRITRFEFLRTDYERGETLEAELEFNKNVYGFTESQLIAVAFPDTSTIIPFSLSSLEGNRRWRIQIPYPDSVVPEQIIVGIFAFWDVRDEEGDMLDISELPVIGHTYPPGDYMAVFGSGLILIPLD